MYKIVPYESLAGEEPLERCSGVFREGQEKTPSYQKVVYLEVFTKSGKNNLKINQ